MATSTVTIRLTHRLDAWKGSAGTAAAYSRVKTVVSGGDLEHVTRVRACGPDRLRLDVLSDSVPGSGRSVKGRLW